MPNVVGICGITGEFTAEGPVNTVTKEGIFLGYFFLKADRAVFISSWSCEVRANTTCTFANESALRDMGKPEETITDPC